MTLIAPPSEMTVIELEDLFARSLKCTFIDEFEDEENCPEEATHLLIPACGHRDHCCEPHAYELATGMECTSCGAVDWSPKVVPL